MVIAPPDMVHAGAGATASMLEGLLEIDAPVQVSMVLNPEPEIVTPVKTGPTEGVRVMVGAVVVTVKVA